MMRKILILAGLLNLGGYAHAWMNASGSLTLQSDSKTLVISSNTLTPTQLLINDPYVTRTWIVNTSSFSVAISTYSGPINSAAAATIPPCVTGTNCMPWSPDGPNSPWWGGMWAVQLGTSTTTSNTISVIRTK